MEHCTYCGVVAQRDDIFKGKVYPSCHECSLLGGGRSFTTLAAKRNYIHTRLRGRYRNVLAQPDWTPEQLAELGDALRFKIGNLGNKKQVIVERIRYRDNKRIPEMNTTCKECGGEFVVGRHDQLFCAKECRTRYFTRERKKAIAEFRRVYLSA